MEKTRDDIVVNVEILKSIFILVMTNRDLTTDVAEDVKHYLHEVITHEKMLLDNLK